MKKNLAFLFIPQVYKNRKLIWKLAKREIIGRYKGSMMGIFWSFLTPLIMLAVYTFFFSVIYQSRSGNLGAAPSKFSFALTLFAGLIPFSLFSECTNRAPQLIISNVNYVKKVIFPLEILPWVNLGSALFHALISVVILLICFVAINHTLHWTFIFLPIVNLPLIFLTVGISWFLASLTVFIRDIVHTINLITMALLFLSPVFYSLSSIPEKYRNIIMLNPLTSIIEQNRAILIEGNLPDFPSLGISLIISIAIAWFGYYWFEKTRSAFADVV